jgi:enolase-phosphatase E1
MIRAILTDIEGTTTSLSFVKDVLFPYAQKHLPNYIRSHAEDPFVVPHLNDVRVLCEVEFSLEGVIKQLEIWMKEDMKVTPLKALQGMLWQEGYEKGDFLGHIYEDAWKNLEKWQQQGIKLYIYSSGSVQAQKLLFGYTAHGDLNRLFSGYFDTNIGTKTDQESYRRIAEKIQLPAADILFLSDVEAELDAARAAGMQTRWLVRGQVASQESSHTQVTDFDAIELP